jgi:hypothetical protein
VGGKKRDIAERERERERERETEGRNEKESLETIL